MNSHTHNRLTSAGFVLVYLSLMGALVISSASALAGIRFALLMFVCGPGALVGGIMIVVARLAETSDD